MNLLAGCRLPSVFAMEWTLHPGTSSVLRRGQQTIMTLQVKYKESRRRETQRNLVRKTKTLKRKGESHRGCRSVAKAGSSSQEPGGEVSAHGPCVDPLHDVVDRNP